MIPLKPCDKKSFICKRKDVCDCEYPDEKKNSPNYRESKVLCYIRGLFSVVRFPTSLGKVGLNGQLY